MYICTPMTPMWIRPWWQVYGGTRSDRRKAHSWNHQRWPYIAMRKIDRGQRRTSQERNEGPPNCVSRHDAPNRGTTSRTPPSCRSCTQSRLLPGNNYQHQANEEDSDIPRRRLQGGERHPRVPSPSARQKLGRIFIRIAAHLHTSKVWGSTVLVASHGHHRCTSPSKSHSHGPSTPCAAERNTAQSSTINPGQQPPLTSDMDQDHRDSITRSTGHPRYDPSPRPRLNPSKGTDLTRPPRSTPTPTPPGGHPTHAPTRRRPAARCSPGAPSWLSLHSAAASMAKISRRRLQVALTHHPAPLLCCEPHMSPPLLRDSRCAPAKPVETRAAGHPPPMPPRGRPASARRGPSGSASITRRLRWPGAGAAADAGGGGHRGREIRPPLGLGFGILRGRSRERLGGRGECTWLE